MENNIWKLVSNKVNNDNLDIAWRLRTKKNTLEFSYRQVYQNTLILSEKLKATGIKENDIVGLCASNGPQWGSAALAIWRIGAILSPIHHGNAESEIIEQVQVVKPKIVLTHNAPVKFDDELAIDFIEASTSFLLEDKNELLIDSSNEAARIYTSGSTGKAKMVRLSHHNLCSNALAAANFVSPVTSNDVFLSLLPLSHAMELTCGMILPLSRGACIVVPRVLAANEIMDSFVQENISFVIAVPRLYRNIIMGIEKRFNNASAGLKMYRSLLKVLPISLRKRFNYPIRKKLGKNLKCCISGGSKLDPKIAAAFYDLGIALQQGYGLTETSPVVCGQEKFDKAFESVGRALEGITLKIVNPDENGIGEVYIKGPNVMLGYTSEELTEEVMIDGWFNSQDLGRLDDKNRLILTGRSKRLIVTEAGKNVYPEDLEIRLERILGVKEAGVLEVSMKPVAVIAIDQDELNVRGLIDDDTSDAEIAKRILREFNETVSKHNQITRFAIVEELPRTPLGKIAIKNLPNLFKENEMA